MTARSVLVLVALALSPYATSAQDLEGCNVAKGCFNQSCSNNPCVAFVTWQTTASGRTKFSMKAERAAGLAWVAVGLRPSDVSSGMAPADVYVCTSSGSEVERAENVVGPWNAENRTIPVGAVTTESISNSGMSISCIFTREPSLQGDDKFYNISGDNAYYILLAIGDNINGDGTITGNRHTDRWASPSAMKLQQEFSLATEAPVETNTPGQELDGCDKTIGCFGPQTCGTDCMAYVTYQTLDDGRVRFTLKGQRSGGIKWVAVGLQLPSDSRMSPADVYACTSGSNMVQRSENVATNGLNSEARTTPTGAVTVESIESQDKMITCTFTRQASDQGADDKFYNITSGNKYFLLLAIGNSINDDGTIQNHQHTNRWRAEKTVGLDEFTGIAAGSQNIALAKAHASLMVIAWVGLASIGITLARYFKPMWPSSKLLGKAVWFTIHRMCMVTCVTCFIVAFVLIFVYVKGFVNTQVKVTLAHAICGIIVTALGIINPIMAIFRPHPGTSKRPIFNWAHWGVGTTAHLLALATILLGFNYNSPLLVGLPSFLFYIMVGFVAFHILAGIVFQVHLFMTQRKVVGPAPHDLDVQPHPQEADRSNDIPMSSSGGTDSTQQLASRNSEPPAGSLAKSILLFIYVSAVSAFVVVLVVYIAIN